jgi:hypothetical protein
MIGVWSAFNANAQIGIAGGISLMGYIPPDLGSIMIWSSSGGKIVVPVIDAFETPTYKVHLNDETSDRHL